MSRFSNSSGGGGGAGGDGGKAGGGGGGKRKKGQSGGGKQGLSGEPDAHFFTLHRRLCQSLSLGMKSGASVEKLWHSADAEVQHLALRSIAAFLDYSVDFSRNRHVQDSVASIMAALEGILASSNESIQTLAPEVGLKLVNFLGESIVEHGGLCLVQPLVVRLSSRSSSVLPCTVALNNILKKLKPWNIKEHGRAWELLNEVNAVNLILHGLLKYKFTDELQKLHGNFKEIILLLCTILWWWPVSRFDVYIWSMGHFSGNLQSLFKTTDYSFVVAVLKMYSNLALCGDLAMELVESEDLMRLFTSCLAKSQPVAVRTEALTFFHRVMKLEEAFILVMRVHCRSVVESIINALVDFRSSSDKRLSSDHHALAFEGCCLGLIVRWPGEHHSLFWNLGIVNIFFSLLLDGNYYRNYQQLFSKEFSGNCHRLIAPYLWDILGWLAIHCENNFHLKDRPLEALQHVVLYACFLTVKAANHCRDPTEASGLPVSHREPSTRAVLYCIFSPSKQIASLARRCLSEVLEGYDIEHVQQLLDYAKLINPRSENAISDHFHPMITLMTLASYSSLPEYRDFIMEHNGFHILLDVVRTQSNNDLHIPRVSIVPHLNEFYLHTCCLSHTQDWEGANIVLFIGLLAIAQLCGSRNLFGTLEDAEKQNIVELFTSLCAKEGSGPGVKWFSAYYLSSCGLLYGFPCNLGKRIKRALNEDKFADTKIVFRNGQPLLVHGVILLARFPSLLVPIHNSKESRVSSRNSREQDKEGEISSFSQEINLSARVDAVSIRKLVEFIYSGLLNIDENHLKQLKKLARYCDVKNLLLSVEWKIPKWGSPVPTYTLTSALESAGYTFSDVILVPREAEEDVSSNCNVCSNQHLHMHAHKVVLWSSCEYLRALFQSGMQDSCSTSIEVPVSWRALRILVTWLYSDDVSRPSFGCLWNNKDDKSKLLDLKVYIELSWLADIWFIENVRESSLSIINSYLGCDSSLGVVRGSNLPEINSYLGSNSSLCVEVMKIASDLSQWEVVQSAVDRLAHMYPKIRNEGLLDSLSEELQEMIRLAHVHLSIGSS